MKIIENWCYSPEENIFSINISTLKEKYMIVGRKIRHPILLDKELIGTDFEYIYKEEEFGMVRRPFWCRIEDDVKHDLLKRRIFIIDDSFKMID